MVYLEIWLTLERYASFSKQFISQYLSSSAYYVQCLIKKGGWYTTYSVTCNICRKVHIKEGTLQDSPRTVYSIIDM